MIPSEIICKVKKNNRNSIKKMKKHIKNQLNHNNSRSKLKKGDVG